MTAKIKLCTLTEAEVLALPANEVWAFRTWPAHLDTERMRAQLVHEARGCPPPFPGAVWNGYCFVGANQL